MYVGNAILNSISELLHMYVSLFWIAMNIYNGWEKVEEALKGIDRNRDEEDKPEDFLIWAVKLYAVTSENLVEWGYHFFFNLVCRTK